MPFATPPDINKPNEPINSQNVYGGEGSEVITTAQIKRNLQYPLDLGVTAGLDSYIEFRLVDEETLDIGNVVETVINSAVALKDKFVKIGTDVTAGLARGASQEEVEQGRGALRSVATEGLEFVTGSTSNVIGTLNEGFNNGQTQTFVDDNEVVYLEPSTEESIVVKLYMPPSFSYSDGVNYDNVELGVGGAMSLNALTKDKKTSVLHDALSLGASTIGAMAAGNSEMTSLAYQRVAGKLSSVLGVEQLASCLLYTSPSPRDKRQSRMPSSA